MPVLKKPAGVTKTVVGAKGATKTKAKDPFAEKYAETPAAKGGGFVPPKPGTYNCIVVAGVGDSDGDRTFAYLEVQICDEDAEDAGKNCRIYWNFTNSDGQDAGGMPYFKSNMAMFGKDDNFESWDEMVEFLAELAKEQPWVVINVVKKGEYTNIYLNSVPENQDEKPELINPY